MNMTVLMGYLGADPYKIELSDATKFGASFKLATNDRIKLKGESVTRTDWHKITVWGKSAKYCLDNFSKGAKVLVKGKIRNSDYIDKDGVKHYSYEVFAESLNFISKKNKKTGKDESVEGITGESVLESETI